MNGDCYHVAALQVWRGRCAATGRRIGGHAPLVLVRWLDALPPTPANLTLLVQAEAAKLEEHGPDSFSPEVKRRIIDRLDWARRVWDDEAGFVPVLSRYSFSTNSIYYVIYGVCISVLCYSNLLNYVQSRKI